MSVRMTGRAAVIGLAVLLCAPPALAEVDVLLPIQGVLRDNAGMPVAEGAFAITFSLHTDATTPQVLWSESWPADGGACTDGAECIEVSGGVFHALLGSHVPLPASVFDAGPSLWLAIQVETDPPLPRKQLGAAPFAARAASAGTASALDCSGCLGSGALSSEAMSAIANEALIAVEAAGYVTAAELPDLASLPANGLADVSNGLITNQFQDATAAGGMPVPIPDHNPQGITSNLVWPDKGIAESLRVVVHVTNSDVSDLRIELMDPAGVTVVLFDGDIGGTVLQTGFPDPTPLVSGDLSGWIGKNPKGNWILRVIDYTFLNNATDGEIVSWGLEVDTLSTKKVSVQGNLEVTGDITTTAGEVKIGGNLNLQGNQILNARFHLSDGPPAVCNEAALGLYYLDLSDRSLRVCIDSEWRRITGICGDGVIDAGEGCDDGAAQSGDGCSASCQTEEGWTCSGAPSSVCVATCGDGLVVGSEECDTSSDPCCTAQCKLISGWAYDGVCLAKASLNSDADNVPAGCQPYHPSKSWGQGDYVTICEHFDAATDCANVDTDAGGGRCTNFLATLSWESNTSPDVWVHATTFTWNPSALPNSCNLYSATGVVVYACQ